MHPVDPVVVAGAQAGLPGRAGLPGGPVEAALPQGAAFPVVAAVLGVAVQAVPGKWQYGFNFCPSSEFYKM